MAEFALSRAASQDLKEIGLFSRMHFGEIVASAYLRGFAAEFERLAQIPQLGSARPEYGETIRSRTYRSHRILYEQTSAGIRIVRILHHAQSVPETLTP